MEEEELVTKTTTTTTTTTVMAGLEQQQTLKQAETPPPSPVQETNEFEKGEWPGKSEREGNGEQRVVHEYEIAPGAVLQARTEDTALAGVAGELVHVEEVSPVRDPAGEAIDLGEQG